MKSGPNAVVKDSESCTMSDISTFPPGTYVGNPFVVINGVPELWASVTDNGDGTGTLQITANYL